MEVIAEVDEIPMDKISIIPVDLNSFASVRKFTDEVNEFRLNRPLDRLVCNAAVYQPSLPYAKWSEDNIEQQFQINFLSHFLMISRFIPALKLAEKARVVMVGSVTGNDNTVGGGGVYPIANLRALEGLKRGMKNPISMADGRVFNGAKAYKDSKLAIMMLSNILHEKYNRATGIAFSSIYPGCIASSPLFREKRPWFRKYFPVFMKYITGGYVGEEEAGQRLFQVITDGRCTRSGVYWSWNGGPREGRDQSLVTDGAIVGAGGAGGDWDSIYENDQSDKVRDFETTADLFRYATRATGADWAEARSYTSPCPTLRVIAAATTLIEKREDLEHERMMRKRVAEGKSIDGLVFAATSSEEEEEASDEDKDSNTTIADESESVGTSNTSGSGSGSGSGSTPMPPQPPLGPVPGKGQLAF